jgi:type IV pilus assembly protein PilY1
MKCVRAWLAAGLLAATALAQAAPPQLVVPHGRLGHTGSDGPSALWRETSGEGGAFVIQTSGELACACGNVQRRALVILDDGTLRYADTPAWDGAALLASAPARHIFTINDAGATIAFDWPNLPAPLQAALDAGDGLGALRADFLRGDRSQEQGQPQGRFRKRTAVLGDIINSNPLIVGAPTAASAGSGHAAFRAQFARRELAVYVGANDGMLHAFSAATGAELFAYVPAAVTAQLAALASPSYRARPYVDGSPGQGDARIGAGWRTVLASGMGMGARGVFALDVTDPAHFEQGKGALWEFTDADDAAMGHVREAPLITAISRDKSLGQGLPRYFAVLSSGINNLAPGGAGALFLLALDKPPGQAWKHGDNYFSIVASGGDASVANALSAPALVVRGDGSATRAYAGDLRGNLWRFDFSTMTAHRLFTARDAAGAAQPIAHAPKVVFAPGGGYLIVFATGKMIEESDLLPPSFTPQSVYAILDAPGGERDSIGSRAQLARRTLSTASSGYAIGGEGFSYFGPRAKKGWYFDFPNALRDGERAAGSPLSIESAIVVASILPALTQEAAPSGRLYLLDALTGFAYDPVSGTKPDGATGELAPFDALQPLLVAGSSTSAGARNATGGATSTRRVTLVRPQAGGASRSITITVRHPSGRLGWREVGNWRELHQAATRQRR